MKKSTYYTIEEMWAFRNTTNMNNARDRSLVILELFNDVRVIRAKHEGQSNTEEE